MINLWYDVRPLSEPSILKKKFDDIFDATKYAKALLAIKAMIKDQKTQIILKKGELKCAKTEKTRAEEVFIE